MTCRRHAASHLASWVLPRCSGTWCYRFGKTLRHVRTCTTGPVPPASAEADAKRFEPAADKLTVYVVRKRWGDAVNVVMLTVDRAAAVETVPESFVRLRLTPGTHVLRVTWSEGEAEAVVSGAAGDIRYVELVGSVWAWASTYVLEPGDRASRDRIRQVRMVADRS